MPKGFAHCAVNVLIFGFKHFHCLRATKIFIAHANVNWLVRAPVSSRAYFIVKILEKTYGGSKAIPLKAKALSFLALKE